MKGYYYLHSESKDLIFRPEDYIKDLRKSRFVRWYWPVDTSNRLLCWRVLVEGLYLGANHLRVIELAQKWNCDSKDLVIYINREVIINGTIRSYGIKKFLLQVCGYNQEEVELFCTWFKI